MIAKIQLELTPREIDVVPLIWQELTAAEIAARLRISPRTVEAHCWNIRQKIRAKSTVGILKYALQAGLISVETV